MSDRAVTSKLDNGRIPLIWKTVAIFSSLNFQHYLQRGIDLPDANNLAVGNVTARHRELEVTAHQQLRGDVLQLKLGQLGKLKLEE